MEEQEIYELFKKRLHRNLKEKINASIYVSINDDVLLIRMSKLNIHWEQAYPNIMNRIIHERDTDKLEHEIVKKFRRIILNTFFY